MFRSFIVTAVFKVSPLTSYLSDVGRFPTNFSAWQLELVCVHQSPVENHNSSEVLKTASAVALAPEGAESRPGHHDVGGGGVGAHGDPAAIQ